jgi:catechol 2,3-dioxygenase-like lactoylglutathione lyase family enzyme
MVCGDPEVSADFYQAAFGFLRPGRGLTPAISGVELRLGSQAIRRPARRPPLSRRCRRLEPAIPAHRDRSRIWRGRTRISPHSWDGSRSHPQGLNLPATSGGVSAFKFRDPEGHPLELIAVPPGAVPPQWRMASQNVCLGIDHSAISVSSTATSIDFYESLGLDRGGGSLNVGREQACSTTCPMRWSKSPR